MKRFLFISFLIIGLLAPSSGNYLRLSKRQKRKRSVYTGWRHSIYAQSMMIARRKSEDGKENLCPRGCMTCDAVNGCQRCRSRMFLFFNRVGNRQTGMCVHACPAGYYGQRSKKFNVCKKCEVPNCASCFTESYCTSCMNEQFLHGATCHQNCPRGLYANAWKKICETEIDCVVSEWSQWSKCARRSSSRSCKYGRKRRTRKIVQQPTEKGKKCPKLKETKRCRTPENKCPLLNNWFKTQLRKNHEKKKKQRSGKKKKGAGKKSGKNYDESVMS